MIPLKTNISLRKWPFFTYCLLLGNIGVFFYQLSLGNDLTEFFDEFALIPQRIWLLENPKGWGYLYPLRSLLTSAFLHGGWLHLLGNMLTLWVFGGGVENRLGHGGFLLFYLLSGIVSAACHTLYLPQSGLPCVGASGAIAGVLGASLILYPRAKVLVLIPLFVLIRIVSIPAILFLFLWFLGQIMLIRHPSAALESPIAVMAHIGGFIFGLVAVFFFRKPSGRQRKSVRA